MGSSVRSYVIAGVTAIAAGVIAIPASVPSAMPAAAQVHHADVHVAPSIDLAASVRSLVATPPNPEHFAAAKAAIARIDPAASAAAAPAAAAVPVPLNAASDWIVSGYQFIQSWVTYGVQLADYALQFIPYGYLISGQINIFYYNLILPISDSIVYGLVVPVVNDPLNPASYVNGLITVGQTTVNAAINTGIAEFNYFFGWLIPPLPPLPPLPLAAARTLQPEAAVTTLAAGLDPTLATAADVKDEPASLQEEKHLAAVVTDDVPDAAGPSASATAAPSATPDPPKTPERPKTTTSAHGVKAQGGVRGGTDGTEDATTTTSNETSESTSATAGTGDAPVKATESSSRGSKGPDAAGRDKGPRNPSATEKGSTNKGAADKVADKN